MSLYSDEFLGQMDPQSLMNVVLKQGQQIEELKQSVVELQQLSSIAESGGTLGDADFDSVVLDTNGLHTTAGLIDINTFFPVTPPSDYSGNAGYAVAHDVNNNCLYLGGELVQTNGKIGGVLANGIVKFDLLTLEFSALIDSGGVNGVLEDVQKIVVASNGDVFFLAKAGSVISFYKWNGTNFTSIAAGTNLAYDEFALGIDSNDDVYVVKYLTAGASATRRTLYKYDGATFTAVTNYGHFKFIYDIYVDPDDNVYFGGDETTISSVTDRVWVYDQSTVTGLGDSFDGAVRAIWKRTDNEINTLFVGGEMTGYLYSYDGYAWSLVSDEVDGAVYALAGNEDSLYMGGAMTDNAANWDGTTLWTVGDGSFNNTVRCITEVNGDFWFAGDFNTFNSRPARAFGILIVTLESALNFMARSYVTIQSTGDISLDGQTIADLLKLDASANTINAIFNNLTINGTLTGIDWADVGAVGGIAILTTTINDDAVYSFTPPATTGVIIAMRRSTLHSANADEFLIGFYSTDQPNIFYTHIGAQTNISTGVLTGTTGTDTKFTVSVHTDGKIYLENRRGGSRVWMVSILKV